MSTSGHFYLVGHPIDHSKSPAMYNAVFDKLGLNWQYELADFESEEAARNFLESQEYQGVNVTTPYKPLAAQTATLRAASTQLAGGANVLVTKKDSLIAYNVDGQGCVRALERAGVSFDEARVAVCGTGPTALAIVHAAAQAGARDILLLGRDRDHCRQVMTDYASRFQYLASVTIDLPADVDDHLSFRQTYSHMDLKFGTYTTSTHAISEADIIIDATPLGMNEGDPAPFDTGLLRAGQTVFDVVYGHGTSALIEAARATGCTTFDGTGMLVAQAALAVRIFCDVAEVDLELTFDELFDIMARAAGFNFDQV